MVLSMWLSHYDHQFMTLIVCSYICSTRSRDF